MPKIISVHSFRRGTGKSNVTANLAALLARRGRRVAIVDANLQSPGAHFLFGLDEDTINHSLNDYLWGRCEIEQSVYDVTPRLATSAPGLLVLIPASNQAAHIARVLREGYDVARLHTGLHTLIKQFELDVVMIDTHAGLNEDTLASVAASDILVVLLRLDQQDYQGTSIIVEVARHLGVPRILLVVNETPGCFDPAEVEAKVSNTYHCPVAAVLPHSEELMVLASASLFALHYSDHPLMLELERVAAQLVSGDATPSH